MKRIVTLLLFALSLHSHAQNYQCLQPSVKHYFTNSYGYLRGIRIDSVRTSGSDIVYYPFHADRGRYNWSWGAVPLDSTGGSWLGKRVTQQADGTFLFDNMWSDTVIIRTQAHTGDSWIFYNDTTGRYYTATLSGEDTMTVLGTPDSIKKIDIHAFTKAGADSADPADTFSLVLSKNHGFVQAIDLYTFPYHGPDSVYHAGLDYYLDLLMSFKYYWSPEPSRGNSLFSLVDFINPTYVQLYDWNPGDVFENQIFYGITDGMYPQEYYYDSIVSKTPVSGGMQFNFRGWTANEHLPPFYFYSGGSPSHNFPKDTASGYGSFTISNALLIDPAMMPEEAGQNTAFYYQPADLDNCAGGARYTMAQTELGGHIYRSFSEASGVYREYKAGIGLVHYNQNILGGSPPGDNDTTLLYYRKGSLSCGNYYTGFSIYDGLGVNTVAPGTISISPNPVTDVLHISASARITNIRVLNNVGQVVIDHDYNSSDAAVDMGRLLPGIYMVRINNSEVKMVVKQ